MNGGNFFKKIKITFRLALDTKINFIFLGGEEEVEEGG